MSTVRSPPEGSPLSFTVHRAPDISVHDDFVSADEARELIAAARGRMHPSRTTDGSHAHLRTSSSYFVPNDDPVASALRMRAAALVSVAIDRMEKLQVCRYRDGERYARHHDFLKRPAAAVGQRTHTILLYLNDVEKGGETVFPHLNLRMHPLAGRAVVFRPSVRGRRDERLLHEALPPRGCEKWVAQIWVRERSHTPVEHAGA